MTDKHRSGADGGPARSASGDPDFTALDQELQALYRSYGEGEDMPPEIRKLAEELQARLAERSTGQG
ncbi:hypothetical protein FKB34_15525 [Glycocaulis profundi]|nr:hypothetical protein FKB34_15525 [Glycocaulis profundi]